MCFATLLVKKEVSPSFSDEKKDRQKKIRQMLPLCDTYMTYTAFNVTFGGKHD